MTIATDGCVFTVFKRCFFKETGGEEFVGLEYGYQTVTEASECMNI